MLEKLGLDNHTVELCWLGKWSENVSAIKGDNNCQCLDLELINNSHYRMSWRLAHTNDFSTHQSVHQR